MLPSSLSEVILGGIIPTEARSGMSGVCAQHLLAKFWPKEALCEVHTELPWKDSSVGIRTSHPILVVPRSQPWLAFCEGPVNILWLVFWEMNPVVKETSEKG